MALFRTVEFTNWRDPHGYRISKGKPGEPWRIVRNRKGAANYLASNPIAKTRDLYLVFARNADTPEGALSFVQLYGPLTPHGNRQGDIIDYVIHHAKVMGSLIDAISAHRRKSPLEGKFDGAVVAMLRTAVVWDPITKTHRWELRPTTLLDALWLQFGEAVTRGAEIRLCAHCGSRFEAGRGAERRAGTRFCSEEHKIAYHSLKRSREK